MKDKLYAFVFRGLLTQETLDGTDALKKLNANSTLDDNLIERLSLDLLDVDLVARASRMATVYTSIATLENTVRQFVGSRLSDEFGENWWVDSVSEKVRKKAESRQEEESKIRWHTPRGDKPLNYTDFGELASIITQNWEKFEPHLNSLEWVKQILKTLERSRNVIMHSGELASDDIERVGSCIRDWVRQVGT
jgi:hypothetical protein